MQTKLTEEDTLLRHWCPVLKDKVERLLLNDPARYHPDTGWALLTTELQSHLLGARQILLEFDNFNCELVCKINPISPVDDNKQHSCSLSVKINSLLVITRGQI